MSGRATTTRPTRTRPLAIASLIAVALAVPGAPASATFPAGDGLIVMEVTTDDGNQLFTMSPDGTGMRQLTHVIPRPSSDHPGASHPDWSPDGRTIVFNENDCQIAIIDADGSGLREVPTEPNHTVGKDLCEGDPAFTPDGLSVVYDRFDLQADQIWRVDLDGTDRKLVTTACGGDPNVSPDGTRMSCGGGGGLWVVNTDGSGAKLVYPTGDIAPKGDWAPDGSVIAFSDGDHPAYSPVNIGTIAPDGTGLRYLTHYDTPRWHAYVGSYSPDGSSIVVRLDHDGMSAQAHMSADGSSVEELTDYAPFQPGQPGNTTMSPQIDWGSAPAGLQPPSPSPAPP